MKEEAHKLTVYVERDLEILMGDFFKNRARDFSQIEAALAQKNWAEVRRIAHILSGVCGGFGFEDLGQMGRELERLSEIQNLEDAHKLYGAMKDYLKTVKVVYT